MRAIALRYLSLQSIPELFSNVDATWLLSAGSISDQSNSKGTRAASSTSTPKRCGCTTPLPRATSIRTSSSWKYQRPGYTVISQ